MADQYTKRAMQALLGLTVTYTLYPVVGAGVNAGATATGGAANTFGVDKEIIAANGITTEFWVCAMDLDTGSAISRWVVELEQAGATSIFAARFDPTAATLNATRIGVPYPVYIAPNVQITARVAENVGAKTINVSVLVATGF